MNETYTRTLKGKVFFIGAGPGDPGLLTVKAAEIIANSDLLLYTGSLVPISVIQSAKQARKIDSAPLTLEEIHSLMRDSANSGETVARVHTGDPSLYGALREELFLLKEDKIDWEVIPGVSAAMAAAAAAGISFTIPEVTQTLIISRLEGRTPMPEKERLRKLAVHGSSLAIYLSSKLAGNLVKELRSAGVPEDTIILCAHRVGWPDQKLIWTTLAELEECIAKNNIERQTTILVLPGEGQKGATSRLYAKDFSHSYRKS